MANSTSHAPLAPVPAHTARFSHTQSKALAGLAVYGLMALAAVVTALATGHLPVPHSLQTVLVLVAPALGLAIDFLIHGLETNDWQVPGA